MSYKMEGLKKLHEGDFNSMSVEFNADGTQIITISKYGDTKVYRFTVVNLYQEDEQVLKHAVIDVSDMNKKIDLFKMDGR